MNIEYFDIYYPETKNNLFYVGLNHSVWELPILWFLDSWNFTLPKIIMIQEFFFLLYEINKDKTNWFKCFLVKTTVWIWN